MTIALLIHTGSTSDAKAFQLATRSRHSVHHSHKEQVVDEPEHSYRVRRSALSVMAQWILARTGKAPEVESRVRYGCAAPHLQRAKLER
jgi:hypothetical protein